MHDNSTSRSFRPALKLHLFTLLAVFLATSTVAAQQHDHNQHGDHGETGPAATTDSLSQIKFSFSLQGDNNLTVSASDFRGRYTLVAFGFTHCAHICPVMAASMAKVLHAVDTDQHKEPVRSQRLGPEKISAVFISVDSERDTPAGTAQYATAFHPAMIGLSGSYPKIAEAAKNFKASFAVTKTQRNYTVQHTSHIYLMSPQGQAIALFPMNITPSQVWREIDDHHEANHKTPKGEAS
ncbi:SCO family protein [Kineobactrum salinum]|uniref:SCO family protein n=1 Tax=Kineobactrum salinum TaxID=2708301 RepID=A0A6C0U6B5_9GAMM|nr:SCO family protein [Kineobactrum salinum]QIB64984.1 SCO family protein [Kineobactrum salinum]